MVKRPKNSTTKVSSKINLSEKVRALYKQLFKVNQFIEEDFFVIAHKKHKITTQKNARKPTLIYLTRTTLNLRSHWSHLYFVSLAVFGLSGATKSPVLSCLTHS